MLYRLASILSLDVYLSPVSQLYIIRYSSSTSISILTATAARSTPSKACTTCETKRTLGRFDEMHLLSALDGICGKKSIDNPSNLLCHRFGAERSRWEVVIVQNGASSTLAFLLFVCCSLSFKADSCQAPRSNQSP